MKMGDMETGAGTQRLLQTYYRDVLNLAAIEWQLQVEERPIRLTEGGGFNATISGSDTAPELAISSRLVELLRLFNSSLINIGLDAVTESHADPEQVQAVVDSAFALIFRFRPPGPPSPVYAKIFDTVEYQEYREEMLSRKKPSGDDARLKVEFQAVTTALLERETQQQLLAWQVKFLFLHELAHVRLGHRIAPPSTDHEVTADREAASLLFAVLGRAGRPLGDVTPLAALLLLMSICYLEDMIDLVARATEFVIKADFRAAFRKSQATHPDSRARILKIIEENRREFDSLSLSIAYVIEYGLVAIKDQIQHGLIDLKYLKWYCRVRGEEMTASWAIREQSPEAKGMLLGVLELQRGWDSADLRRGPLVPAVFSDRWFSPILIGRVDK